MLVSSIKGIIRHRAIVVDRRKEHVVTEGDSLEWTRDYSRIHPDFHVLSRPAQQALIHAGWTTPELIGAQTEKSVLALHGMGPKSIPMIRDILARHGLELKAR